MRIGRCRCFLIYLTHSAFVKLKESHFQGPVTDVLKDTLNPVWNHEAHFADFADGDTLKFTIWDRDFYKPKCDDFLGYFEMSSDMFFPQGFDDEVLLLDAGKNQQAYLKVKVAPMLKQEEEKVAKKDKSCTELGDFPKIVPKHARSELGASNSISSASSQYHIADRRSSNKNELVDYIWLKDALCMISSNQAGKMNCKHVGTKTKLTAIFFVLGGCPNAFCGMQVVLFAVDDSHVDFWWVKPSKTDPKQLEKETLNRHDKGKYKNDPGRSRAFYTPLATLFQDCSQVKDWKFGLKRSSNADEQVVRAILENSQTNEILYLIFLWQEDWTQNPFASSKFIKGKLVYQRSEGLSEYFYRQYEIHDGALVIADFEDGPASDIMELNTIKTVYDIG